ncbi:MAG: hypothetical protein L3K23_02140 [Thermoplasmata archaeon]|nr:hypothetical protein [Thermoplasmata archaeon]
MIRPVLAISAAWPAHSVKVAIEPSMYAPLTLVATNSPLHGALIPPNGPGRRLAV